MDQDDFGLAAWVVLSGVVEALVAEGLLERARVADLLAAAAPRMEAPATTTAMRSASELIRRLSARITEMPQKGRGIERRAKK